MKSFIVSFLKYTDKMAVTYPQTWIYSFACLGIVTGLFLLGGMAWLIATPFGYGQEGFYLGAAYYAWWFTSNVDALKARTEASISELKSLRDAHL